jgi:hypothetical protein
MLRLRSVSAAAVALAALLGVAQTASASPAREVASAANLGIIGNEEGGVLQVTPITEQEYDDVASDQTASCVTDMGMTLCQQALFDNGDGEDRYEMVRYSAVASLGRAAAAYPSAEVRLAEGDVLGSTGGSTGATSPYIRIEWLSPLPAGYPGSDGPGIDIPAEASGMYFQMTLTVPGVGAVTGFCPSDPETQKHYPLHCSLYPPTDISTDGGR